MNMTKGSKYLLLLGVAASALSGLARSYDVAAYVWPAYHPEPRWRELGIFADGKGEWQSLYEAEKRKDGDIWGVRPLWGYTDESNPVDVAHKIDAAVSSGVSADFPHPLSQPNIHGFARAARPIISAATPVFAMSAADFSSTIDPLPVTGMRARFTTSSRTSS